MLVDIDPSTFCSREKREGHRGKTFPMQDKISILTAHFIYAESLFQCEHRGGATSLVSDENLCYLIQWIRKEIQEGCVRQHWLVSDETRRNIFQILQDVFCFYTDWCANLDSMWHVWWPSGNLYRGKSYLLHLLCNSALRVNMCAPKTVKDLNSSNILLLFAFIESVTVYVSRSFNSLD